MTAEERLGLRRLIDRARREYVANPPWLSQPTGRPGRPPPVSDGEVAADYVRLLAQRKWASPYWLKREARACNRQAARVLADMEAAGRVVVSRSGRYRLVRLSR